MSDEKNLEQRNYSFSEKTKKSCLVISASNVNDFVPIYPDLLRFLDPVTLQIGIWILGSRELVEFINPTVGIDVKAARLAEMLAAISRLQSVSKIMVRKSDQSRFYAEIRKVRGNALANVSANENERQLVSTYLDLCEASSKIMTFADRETMKHSEQVAMRVVTAMAKTESAGDFLVRMLQCNNKMLDHSSFAALIALSIGKHMKLDEKQQTTLGLGCLFMDVGITRLDLPDYYTKTLDPSDQAVFERHPLLSVEMLTELEIHGVELSEEVFQIALQHHERFNGHGFPNRRRGRLQKDNSIGMNLLACIVALAERFTILFKENEGKTLFKPLDAIKLLNRLRDDFDPFVLAAFNEVVGFDPGYSKPVLVPVIEP